MSKITDRNNRALEEEAIKRTKEVDDFLRENKVSKCPIDVKRTLATVRDSVHSLNKVELTAFQYYLELGTKIIKLEGFFDTKNSKVWGKAKKQFGLGKDSLEETAFKLARKVVFWKPQIDEYFDMLGTKPFEVKVTNNFDDEKLAIFGKKYKGKPKCSPSGVVEQIEQYYKANMPKEFERVTGNKVKTAQPTKKVEAKKPTQKQMGTIAKTLKPLPTPVIETYKKTVITKEHLGLTVEELLAKVA